jgi:hypothetical protein
MSRQTILHILAITAPNIAYAPPVGKKIVPTRINFPRYAIGRALSDSASARLPTQSILGYDVGREILGLCKEFCFWKGVLWPASVSFG